MIGILSTEENEELLWRQHVGHLGVLADGEPYVVPITYVYADGCVCAHTLLGRKLAALRAHPRACFEVDARDGTTWRSVVAEADYEELTDETARRATLARLGGIRPEAVPVAVPGVVFRLRLTAVSGRVLSPVAPTEYEAAAGSPLLGVSLRAGDAWNYPTPSDWLQHR